MNRMELAFVLAGLCAIYPHLIYPMLVMLAARLRPAPPLPASISDSRPANSLSIVMAARNEPRLAPRVAELRSLISACNLPGELIVVLDGCKDSTICAGPGVKVIELPQYRGKAAALNAGCAAAEGEILVFADARQTWDRNALGQLLAPFADPNIGAVSGELAIDPASGIVGGFGLYWRLEKWIRKQESRLHSTVGVTGAISAVRAKLYHPLPTGLILDDVYWPLRVGMDGYRIVFQEKALAYDKLPEKAGKEFRRKVRTQSGNFQLVRHLPSALNPWRNSLFWQFASHKLMRLVTPWALLMLLAINLLLIAKPLFLLLFIAQCTMYFIALLGMTPLGAAFRPAASASAFALLNAAAWTAFWVWALGRAERSWNRTSYIAPKPASESIKC